MAPGASKGERSAAARAASVMSPASLMRRSRLLRAESHIPGDLFIPDGERRKVTRPATSPATSVDLRRVDQSFASPRAKIDATKFNTSVLQISQYP